MEYLLLILKISGGPVTQMPLNDAAACVRAANAMAEITPFYEKIVWTCVPKSGQGETYSGSSRNIPTKVPTK